MKCYICQGALTTADFNGICQACRNRQHIERLNKDYLEATKNISLRIVDYCTLSSDNNQTLNILVKEKLDSGWILYGPPMLAGVQTSFGSSWQIAQALVKYEN